MEPLAIVILVGAIALVVFTVVFNVVRKVRGKSACGCCASAKKQDMPFVGGGEHACTGCCAHCKGCDRTNTNQS